MQYPSASGDLYPNHSTPSRMPRVPYTQLQFNLNPSNNNGAPQMYKPRPIVIEKLLPYPTKPLHAEGSVIKDTSNIPDTMLSSERLAFAMQLAKMDIKKLKSMLHSGNSDDTKVAIPAAKVVKKKVDSERSKKAKKVDENRKQELNVEQRRHVIHLYPEPKNNTRGEAAKAQKKTKVNYPPVVEERKVTTGKDNEIKRLREELVRYSQILDGVVQKLNQQKFQENIRNDEELMKERERDTIRAEEQGNRSARTLYMLQRKVEDLHNELSAKSNVRQTKKSQYLTNLASAHRAAVRALQSFVKHAPLHYNNTGKLPPMYKALALLIQELTTLSSGTELDFESRAIETIEDLIASLSKTNVKYFPNDVPIKKSIKTASHSRHTPDKQGLNKSDYLDKRIDWLKKKADELNIKSFREGDESTPERASSLRHAIHSLGEEKAISKQIPLKKEKKQPKSSVLLPNELKKKRFKIPARSYYHQPPGNMNYAAGTVVSKIRKKEPVEKRAKTPPSTPQKSVAFTDEDGPSTPRKRDQKIIDKARLLLSPSQQRRNSITSSPNRPDNELEDIRLTPTKVKLMEKEIQRDQWLEERKSRETSKLHAIEKMNTNWLNMLKNDVHRSIHLVDHAEEQIKERLMPLLQKAKEISEEEAKREEQYKTSVNRRLADIASQKAMSEGERLAEYILDDLIQEAALDIQRIEEDEATEMEAAFMIDRINMESIAQRLEDMEKEEEEVRRRWKSVQYSEIDTNVYGNNLVKESRDDLNTSHNTARSVMFTASSNLRTPPPVPDETVQENPDIRKKIFIPEGPLNTILQHKEQFENYLEKSIHNSWSVHPVDVMEDLSEYMLDEMLIDVSTELNEHCSKFVDDIYEKEFLNTT